MIRADSEWDLGLRLRASDRASSLCDISCPGSHGCGAGVFLREPHAKLGFVVRQAEGAADERLDVDHDHPLPPVCASLSPSSSCCRRDRERKTYHPSVHDTSLVAAHAGTGILARHGSSGFIGVHD
jgi:hypothetical protein